MPITRQPNDDWNYFPNTAKDWATLIGLCIAIASAMWGFMYTVKFLLRYFYG